MGPVDIDTLFEYIKYNDATELNEAFMDGTIDPNLTNSDGWSLLHIACKLVNLNALLYFSKMLT